MPEIEPKLEDGKRICHRECPSWRGIVRGINMPPCRLGYRAYEGGPCTPWYQDRIEELEDALRRCGDWVCCQQEELGSPCYELGHSDDWCPLCYGHAMVHPDGVPARKLKEEKGQ